MYMLLKNNLHQIIKNIKMKKIIFGLLLTILMVACNKEQVVLPDLMIEEVKSFLPMFYFEANTLVYTNELGEEKKLNLKLNDAPIIHSNKNNTYNADQIHIELIDPENENFKLDLLGTAQYLGDDASVSTTLISTLTEVNNPDAGTTLNMIRFVDGMPQATSFVVLRAAIQLNNTTFFGVFSAIGSDIVQGDFHSYSELNINAEFGVVAFRDENNELWVFDRME